MKSTLAQIQLERLNLLLDHAWKRNPFYREKWRHADVKLRRLTSLNQLDVLPFTTRAEFVADQTHTPPLGTNLSCPLSEVKSIHTSSGTSRAPLLWGDTSESWQWLAQCSRHLYLLAGIKPGDRIFLFLNFGASSGPWILHAGACALNCHCETAGQAPPKAQLSLLKRLRPTVLVGKPTRLLELAIAAQEAGVRPDSMGLDKLIFPGEPSRQTLRPQLEDLWAAACFDRYGLTEAGSVASECLAHSGGMHILEDNFIAEVVHPETGSPVEDDEVGELVLTNLGRLARPIIRYRTGDCVRLVRQHHCPCGRTEALLMGDVVRNYEGAMNQPLRFC